LWVVAELFPKLHWNDKKKRNGLRFNLFRRRRILDGELLHSSALERIRSSGYAPSNLSKAFRKHVKSLAAVPSVLAYAETPAAAPVGLTPELR
jgi:hypothetical protein